MEKVLYGRKPLFEMIVIVAIMLISFLFFPQLKGLIAILAIFYFIVEGKLRGRSSESIGFKWTTILEDLKQSLLLIILVSIVFQVSYFYMYTFIFPDVLEHVLERASLIQTFNVQLIFSLLVLALGEEIIFRGLIQGRLQSMIKPAYAVILTSIIFACMHISKGDINIVLIDIVTVFIDSMMFGVIFYKTKNIYISWVAHALANIVATLLFVFA